MEDKQPIAHRCRGDGRCQYAIDVGAEGLGHCPEGKCVMPADSAAAPAAKPDFSDAYEGAREDLAIWKRRALHAENQLRDAQRTIKVLGDAINEENGPTFMGEPVIAAHQPPAPSDVPMPSDEIDEYGAACQAGLPFSERLKLKFRLCAAVRAYGDARAAQALEQAAKVADDYGVGFVYTAEMAGHVVAIRASIAAAIRALAKEKGE